MKTINVDGKEVPLVEPAEVITTIKIRKQGKFIRMKKL
jgi:hypothetical protein